MTIVLRNSQDCLAKAHIIHIVADQVSNAGCEWTKTTGAEHSKHALSTYIVKPRGTVQGSQAFVREVRAWANASISMNTFFLAWIVLPNRGLTNIDQQHE